MRTLAIALVAAAAAFAAPAMAQDAPGQGRVEARGGVVWLPGDFEATAGVAAGYDFDLGKSAFVGGEVSADKVLTSGTKVAFGFTGRAGIKASDAAKVFVTGGYTTEFASGLGGNWHAGAGVNYDVTKNVYLTAEYRHFFKNDVSFDADAVVGGVGFKF